MQAQDKRLIAAKPILAGEQCDPVTSESETAYAVRETHEALARLDRALTDLAQRLEPVLQQDIEDNRAPSAVTGKAQRILSSTLANQFRDHSFTAEVYANRVFALIERLAV